MGHPQEHYVLLKAGQYARLNITQHTVNIAVAIFDPAGKLLFTVDNKSLQRLHAEEPASGFDAEAFRTAERGRARSLLEVLGESAVGIRRGADAALLSRERDCSASSQTWRIGIRSC
jgi:hypothetical protein